MAGTSPRSSSPICLSPSCARASHNSVDRIGWRSAPAHQCSLGKGPRHASVTESNIHQLHVH
jgi:hypothetical protein